jgi:hypothetical protein
VANIDDAFRIDKLSLNDNILITEGSIDPSTTGYEAGIGSLFFNSSTGAIFHKFGPGDTDWNRFGEVDASAVFAALKEPTGFISRETSTLLFDTITRTFTITPLTPALSFTYYIKGQKFIIETSVNIILPDITGTYYIYLDGNRTLQYQTYFTDTLLTEGCIVTIIYWNKTVQEIIYFGDERHGCVMDGITHTFLHRALKTQYISGLSISNGTFATNTQTDAAVQLIVSDGAIADEDLVHTITNIGNATQVYDLSQQLAPIAQIPVFYRLGATGEWFYKQADSYPFIYTGTAGYSGTRIPINEWTGTTWQLTEVADGSYGLIHLFATNNIHYPIIAVQGLHQYINVPDGLDTANREFQELIGMPFQEFTPIATIIFKTANSITNSHKIIYVNTAANTGYVDWRNITNTTSVHDHGSLTGLTKDDHLIYALSGVGSTRTFNVGDLYNVHDVSRTIGDNNKVFGLTWTNALSEYTINTIALNGLSDVNVVENASINNYVLTWNNSTSKWIASPAAQILALYDENSITPTAPAALGVNSIALGSGAQTNTSADKSLAIGDQSLARTNSSMVFAGGRFGSTGDAQVGKYLLRTITINNTATEAFIDGANGSIRLILPDDATWSFSAMITAHQTNGVGRAGYKLEGVIYRVAGANTTAIQGRVLKTVLAESSPAWDINIVADTVNGALKVIALGENSKTIRWVCSIDTVEITN